MEVTNITSMEQEIHVLVKVMQSKLSWCFLAIYASPRFYERYILWDNLVKVAEVNTIPWVVTEDFNEMLLNSEKFGGRLVSTHRSLLFKECIDTCNLVDIGFSAPKYTWTNKREVLDLI